MNATRTALRSSTPISGARTPSVLSVLRRWAEAMRQRRALSRLSAEQLADIGVSPEEANAEFGRPFWDAPAGWR